MVVKNLRGINSWYVYEFVIHKTFLTCVLAMWTGLLMGITNSPYEEDSASGELSPTVQLDDSSRSINLTPFTSLWVDKGAQTPLHQIKEQDFRRFGKSEYLLGFSPNSYWIRFELVNISKKNAGFIVQATNWFIDEADLYEEKNGTLQLLGQAGDLLPFKDRDLKSKYPSFRIQFETFEKKIFYLKIRNTQFNQFKLSLVEINHYYQSRETGDSKELISGLILMRFAFHLSLLLFLYRDIKLRVFSYWGIFLCAVYYFSSGYSGYLFSGSPYLTNKAFYFVVSFAPLALCYYIYTIFDLRKELPRIKWIYYFFIGLGFLNLLLTFFIHHWLLSWAYIAFMAFMVTFHFVSSVIFYIKFPKPSFWYISTLALYLPAFSFYYARNAGLIVSDLNFNIIQFTFFLDFLTVSFISAAQLKLSKKENSDLQESVYLKNQEAKQLEELDKLKTRFFTNISHEFRTPLSLILGPVMSLISKYPQEPLLQTMKKNVLRLQQLINQMLDLGKLEAGQEKVNLQTTELNTFLTQMIQNLNPLLDEKNQKIRITIPAENHIVSLDADKLEKILSNLISNAIKYSSPNDQIHFTALLEDGLLTVQVQDEGPGIDSADLPFIFQRFYRASTGKSRFEKGTGVGLALVKELTDLLGGKIQVESHKGKGSTFTLKMPLEIISDKKTDAETLRDSDPEAMSQVLSGAEQGSILIVEDNPDLRSYLGQILSPGYQLSFCGNGLEAWIKLTAGLSPDLIVSDVMMPNMDGYELCKKVKTHPGTSHIPVVLLTAKASLQAKIEGLKKGADVYLSKPFHPEELLLTIKNQQTLRRSYRKVFENLVTLENPDENHKNQIPENLQDDYDLIQGLNTFLESQHSDSELTLEKICKKAGIGKTHLTHKFSTLTGYTPMQYLRNLRLEKAKTLLLESKKSVSDIAYTVGFNDPKYFSRQFQQKFGAFPTEWRQSGQDN